jgi:hypothetical protein
LIALPEEKGTVTGECALCMLLYFLAGPRPIEPGSVHDTTIYRSRMQSLVEREFDADEPHGFDAMLYVDKGFTYSKHVTCSSETPRARFLESFV